MNVTSYLPGDLGVIQAHGTHFRTVYGEQTEIYGVGALRWDVVKLPKEEKCKLCVGGAEGEGAGRKSPKNQAGKHLRAWGEVAGLPGKVCVWCSYSLARCLGLGSEATLPGHDLTVPLSGSLTLGKWLNLSGS